MAKNTQSSAKVSGSSGVTTGHVAELLRYEANKFYREAHPETGNATPAEQLVYAMELLAKVANGELTPENLYYNAYNAGMDTISTADCPRG